MDAMADIIDLSVGDRVTVTYDNIRSKNSAVVQELPPFTQTICGSEETVTDKVRVRYANNTNSGLLGDMMENVNPEQIE
jgi:hypothetical protein